MSDGSAFKSASEEVAALMRELTQIREVLRDISNRVGQIERHVKRAFTIPAKDKSKPIRQQSANAGGVMKPQITSADALREFDELVSVCRDHGPETIINRLNAKDHSELRVIAVELGLPAGSKVSRKQLTSSIAGRVRESLLLSTNRNVTEPRSASATSRTPEEAKKEE